MERDPKNSFERLRQWIKQTTPSHRGAGGELDPQYLNQEIANKLTPIIGNPHLNFEQRRQLLVELVSLHPDWKNQINQDLERIDQNQLGDGIV